MYDLGLRFTEKHFVDLYGISPDHIAEIVNTQQGGGMFAEGESKPKPKAKEPQGRSETREFAESLAEKCSNINLTKPIHDLVANATSLEEIRDGLIGLYAEMPMDELAEEMEQAFLAADLAGRMEILKKAGLA
jgi:phage gp29-like protein